MSKSSSRDSQPPAGGRSKGRDPHAERESLRYERPIPSREFILDYLKERGKPATRERIAEDLGLLEDEELFEAVRRRLRAMERDGQVIYNRRGGYVPVDMSDLVRGRVIGHRDGFGFVVPDTGGEDVFLNNREMGSVLHGDRVVVSVTGVDRRGRREGALVEVIERAHKALVGHFRVDRGIGFVEPDNPRIPQSVLVHPEDQMGAKDGQIVMVEIVEQPSRHRGAIGRVTEVMGDQMDPGMEIDIAIRAHEIPQEWPAEVDEEIADLRPEVPEAAKEGRVDLRDVPLVTIDGADARDFDDAVFCKRTQSGWKVVVAIADVSHYVKPETALDQEAYQRGNSVYFPERVIPMLPEILSNGLCSINPEVDRLCMAVELFVNEDGEVHRAKFLEGVMRSHARFTYDQVQLLLDGADPILAQQYKKLLPQLRELHALYKVLNERRRERGALELETTETRIVFGENRKIEAIVPVHRHDSHKIIEECMLLANQAAARFLLKRKLPALYRIHDGPAADKLEDLRKFLGEFGLHLRGGAEPQPADFLELLDVVRERPDSHLIQTVLMRSLKQAVYSPDNIGHFGLAYEEYAHFTSPIRRYPDLLVHRAIRHALRGGTPADFDYSTEDMIVFGDHCSSTERRADEATRDAVDWLKCEFMMDKVGETYTGTVKAVTSFGLFVELDEVYVEGLVHITALRSDFYHFDAVGHRLMGDRTGRSYRLADRVRVKVMRVDLDQKKIDFDLSDDDSPIGSRDDSPREPRARRDGAGKDRQEQGKSRDGKRHGKPASGHKGGGRKSGGGTSSGKKNTGRKKHG